jgi:hypothetical protein
MSIRRECIDHIRQGRLFRLGFLVPGRPEKRTVLMSQEINDLVSGPWSSDLMEDRCYRLRANLESILAGDLLNVCWGPYKGKPHHHIGRLDKPEEEVWDIRSVDKPGLRTLFRFAEKKRACRLHMQPKVRPRYVVVSHTACRTKELGTRKNRMQTAMGNSFSSQ